jgi:hypothetical protein
MANEQAAEAAPEVEDKGAEVADQFAEADAKADPSVEAPSLEDIASQMGWVPQEKFKGPEDKWKPADKFIIDGKDIQERQSRELKGIRETLETIKATSSSIMVEKLAEQHKELSAKYQAAVENGDPDEAWKAANAIRDLQTKAEPSRPSSAGETVSWVEKNQRVKNDPLAWNRALAVCDAFARSYPNSTPAEQLAYTEQVLKGEYPALFDDKPPAGVNAPASRNSGAARSTGKTTADLPKEAREYGQELIDRGVIPNMEAFTKHYFEQLQKRK